jgi:DNA-binding XRE family transcriptional regulator
MSRLNTPQYHIDMKRIRRELGMTQQALADRLHVSRTAVLNWERRGNQPSAPVLPLLAQVIGCKIEDLYDTLPAHD